MSSTLKRVEDVVRSALAVAVAVVLGLIAAICFVEVVRRPFGGSFVWYDEFVGYLLVWLTFLGAVLARSHKQHIGVDNLIEKSSGAMRRTLVIANHVVMIAVHVVLLVYGYQLMSRFLTERAITVDVPMGIVYAVIPLSALLMLVIEALHLARSLGAND